MPRSVTRARLAFLVLLLVDLPAPLLIAQAVPEAPPRDFLPRSIQEPLPPVPGWAEDPWPLDERSFSLDPARRIPPGEEQEGKSAAPQTEPPPKPGPAAPESPRVFPPPHDSLADFADAHVSALAWRAFVWEDYLIQPDVLLPAGLGLAAGIVHPWDKRWEEHWHGLLGGRQTYSNVGNDTLIVSSVLIGMLFPGEGRNYWDETWSQGEAFGSTALTVFVAKTLVARPRPGSTPTTGNGTHSFPSGHASSAFAGATLIERNSGFLAGLPAYGLAAFTAFERVEAGRHYPSDVLAGAAVGTLSAGIFDSLHWGSGEGRGIARLLSQVELGFEDRLHGVDLGLSVRF